MRRSALARDFFFFFSLLKKMSEKTKECAVPHCGVDEEGSDGDALLLAVCTNGHWMHRACIEGLVRVADEGEDDGLTSSRLRCPQCRDEAILSAWQGLFDPERHKERTNEGNNERTTYQVFAIPPSGITMEEHLRNLGEALNAVFDYE